MRVHHRLPLGLVLLLVAGATAVAADLAPPTLRLPQTARPIRYDLDLTIVPDQDTFRGSVDIEVEIAETTPIVWLNSTGLEVDRVDVTVGGKSVAAKIVSGGEDFLGLGFERPVGPGKAKVHLDYRGTYELTDTHGMFKQKEGGEWYAYSQFEATYARKAVPCFDEPIYKVPWQLTLHVPKALTAVSNTRTLDESDEPGGMKRVRFARTKPLPSYLVALAVGPFDMLDAGVMGKNKVPYRFFTTRGHAQEARYAAEATREIVQRLESYFGIPYPYDKLDQVAIPETVAFSAMENAGMITYIQTRLVSSQEELTPDRRRLLAGIIAHEIAHQWFGDLVTMEYWDDIWLNESFASWMGAKVVDQWRPEWDGAVRGLMSRSRAMNADALITARKVHQPIVTRDDIENAFDAISYSKGSAVLSMFESFMGPEKFRAGVQAYLKKHAWGNATSQDFLAALSSAGGPEVGAAFSTFLEQPGVPLVAAALHCAPGGPAHLSVAQERFLPTGSKGSAQQLWKVPVCVRWDAGEGSKRTCTMLEAASGEIPLGDACPKWVLANDGERGYYVVAYEDGMASKLLDPATKDRTLAERAGLLDDIRSLVRAGRVSISETLAMAPQLARDPSRHIVSRAARIVGAIQDDLVSEKERPNYARFVRGLFGERARAVGLTARPDEDEDTKFLREDLVPLVADAGEDRNLRAEARKLALAWLDDRKAIDPDMVPHVLRLAALDGDRALYDRYREAAKSADRRDRRRILASIGSFRDPAIVQSALDLMLGDEFEIRETSRIVGTVLEDPATRQVGWEFVKRNFDALAKRMPSETRARLFASGARFCDEVHREEAEKFFRERTGKFPGAPRTLDQALETVALCAAQRSLQGPDVGRFLAAY